MMKIILVLAFVLFSAATALAETVEGTISSVNTADRSFTVLTPAGESVRVSMGSDAVLNGVSVLGDLRSGDRISVNGNTNSVTSQFQAVSVSRVTPGSSVPVTSAAGVEAPLTSPPASTNTGLPVTPSGIPGTGVTTSSPETTVPGASTTATGEFVAEAGTSTSGS